MGRSEHSETEWNPPAGSAIGRLMFFVFHVNLKDRVYHFAWCCLRATRVSLLGWSRAD